MTKKIRFTIKFLLMSLTLLALNGVPAYASSLPSTKTKSANMTLLLESNSFNAKKRSNFSIGSHTEHIDRGLTLIHFQTPVKYEFRTFDTHSDPQQAAKMAELLWTMQQNNAHYAILAHDSAAKGLITEIEKLKKMGFVKLSGIKSRQAFIAHNLDGRLVEIIDDQSISISITVPAMVKDNQIYFPKVKYEFEPSIDRYIAHAGGEINGVKSTNSKQALDANYKKGFRLFELDIIETSDGKKVAAHDWKMWSRFTDYQGALPPSHSVFMKHKIYGDYTTLDMKGINAWFTAHPDATLVTDKVKDPLAFANAFVDKDRLLMELFSLMAVEEASKNGVQVIISQDPLMAIKEMDKIDYLVVNNVKHVALSRRILASNTDLMLQLKAAGIRVYVYNVNFDPGKDEQYVLENEIGLVYGMYADKWVFDTNKSALTK